MNATPLESVVNIGIAFSWDPRTLSTMKAGPVIGQVIKSKWSVDPCL